MTWEPRMLPDVTPESELFWAGAAEGEFRLRECGDCGLTYHPPRALCPDCLGQAEWVTASGTGTVYSYTVVERIDSWDEAALPAIVAYVELEEGPRVMTTVVGCEPSAVSIGMPVSVTFEETTAEDVAVPVFEPDT